MGQYTSRSFKPVSTFSTRKRDDFSFYPRTLEDDQIQLAIQKVDYLLLFAEKEIYPDAYHIRVTETGLSEQLEGYCRLGYFTGMLTVVLKYLNLVQLTQAYYGEKIINS